MRLQFWKPSLLVLAGPMKAFTGTTKNSEKHIQRQLSLVASIAHAINPLDDLEADLGSFEIEQLVVGPWDQPLDEFFSEAPV